jgi:hypothetical protein
MKCTKCGYEVPMTQFTRAKNMGSCCSGIHLRQCPKCQELSPCDPLMEERWEEKNNQKRDDQEGLPFDYFEC